MLAPSIDTIRLFIHLLAAAVWVGGQFVLAGVVPGLRAVDIANDSLSNPTNPNPTSTSATKAAANGFARVAWPAFGIAFATGIWNILAIDGSSSLAYNMTLGLKLLFVVAAGGSALVHSQTSRKPMMAITGAVGAVASVAVLFLGVLLSNPA